MNRSRLSRPGDDAVAPSNAAAVAWPAAEEQAAVPDAGDMLFEIGFILAVHLAFAVAVLLTLDAHGVT